jgi:Predicted integral membrane protein (DUF2269)
MTMPPGLRKFALTVHLVSSVGWIGAVMAYLALGLAAVTSPDTRTVRAAWTAMEVTGWWAIVPLALAALLTGLVMALGTRWGLFRHYWVLISLALTILCTVVLAVHMPTVSAMASMARQAEGGRPARAWRRPRPSRCRPAGVARHHRAQCLQAGGRDPVRVAETARAVSGAAAGRRAARVHDLTHAGGRSRPARAGRAGVTWPRIHGSSRAASTPGHSLGSPRLYELVANLFSLGHVPGTDRRRRRATRPPHGLRRAHARPRRRARGAGREGSTPRRR